MASSMNHERRVAALEIGKRRDENIAIPLISARLGEAADDAVSRHIADHGALPAVVGERVNAIVLVPVAPLVCAA